MGLVNLPIGWIVAGVVALGALGYVAHCEHVKKDRAQFIAKLESQAAQQKEAAEKKAQEDRKAKEQADEQTQSELDQLHRTIKRLRDERARASSVPAAPAGSSRPDLACFDRTLFSGAVGNFEAGVEGLVVEGATAAIELDNARRWARDVFNLK